MTAADHLNATQWPVEEVGKLTSGNRPGMSIADEYHQREVLGNHEWGDHAHARQYGYPDAATYQDALARHVAQHGIVKPVAWERGNPALGESPDDRILANGYHRYAAARALGHATVPVVEWSRADRGSRDPVPGWDGET